MSYLKDYKKFVIRTGMIFDRDSLAELCLDPSAPLGIFCRDRTVELQEFCQTNPEYHIVTQLNPNVLVNRLAPGGFLFFLADGDQDRRLIFDHSAASEGSYISILRSA